MGFSVGCCILASNSDIIGIYKLIIHRKQAFLLTENHKVVEDQVHDQKGSKPLDRLSLITLVLGVISFFVWNIVIIVPLAGIVTGILSITRFDESAFSGKWSGRIGLLFCVFNLILFFIDWA